MAHLNMIIFFPRSLIMFLPNVELVTKQGLVKNFLLELTHYHTMMTFDAWEEKAF